MKGLRATGHGLPVLCDVAARPGGLSSEASSPVHEHKHEIDHFICDLSATYLRLICDMAAKDYTLKRLCEAVGLCRSLNLLASCPRFHHSLLLYSIFDPIKAL
jgi:hypothetical protein